MSAILASTRSFVASADDFGAQARSQGWTFWRGYALGCVSTVTVLLPLIQS